MCIIWERFWYQNCCEWKLTESLQVTEEMVVSFSILTIIFLILLIFSNFKRIGDIHCNLKGRENMKKGKLRYE